MNYASPIIDKYNAFVGVFVAIANHILGEYWTLFAAFLLLNLIDVITGWMRSRIIGNISSNKGYTGILKKVGYWLIIMVAFLMSSIFIDIGESIQVDLGLTSLLGWFVLATFIVNEIRSILENFVEAGFHVPTILIKGLEVAQNVLDSDGEIEIDTSNPDKDVYRLNLNCPVEDLSKKDRVIFKVNPDATVLKKR